MPNTLVQSTYLIGGRAVPDVHGISRPAANVQIPWELAGQSQVAITDTVAGVVSNTQAVSLVSFAPGIFSMNMSGIGQGAILDAGTSQLATAGTPVLRGGYIAIFCTGLGAVTNQPATGAVALSAPLSYALTQPTVMIGGISGIAVSYAGLAPTLVGLYQVNVQVPPGVTPGNTVPVVLSIGGVQSNTVTIAVQ